MTEQPDRNYLLEPEIAFDGKRAAEFKQIYVEAVARGPDSLIDYRLDCPKYEFLAYLSEHEKILFHGSNDSDIQLFEPRRRSLDGSEEGSMSAVYATPDGIWSMFFAVLDRKRFRMSMRN